jgi:hypothetical protein
MLHARARFESAVTDLVTEGSIKTRLHRAFETHLSELEDAELPAELRQPFNDLNSALRRFRPVGRQSQIGATVQKMSSTEAARHAESILRIYCALAVGQERAEPLKVVETPAAPPPRFLARRS